MHLSWQCCWLSCVILLREQVQCQDWRQQHLSDGSGQDSLIDSRLRLIEWYNLNARPRRIHSPVEEIVCSTSRKRHRWSFNCPKYKGHEGSPHVLPYLGKGGEKTTHRSNLGKGRRKEGDKGGKHVYYSSKSTKKKDKKEGGKGAMKKLDKRGDGHGPGDFMLPSPRPPSEQTAFRTPVQPNFSPILLPFFRPTVSAPAIYYHENSGKGMVKMPENHGRHRPYIQPPQSPTTTSAPPTYHSSPIQSAPPPLLVPLFKPVQQTMPPLLVPLLGPTVSPVAAGSPVISTVPPTLRDDLFNNPTMIMPAIYPSRFSSPTASPSYMIASDETQPPTSTQPISNPASPPDQLAQNPPTTSPTTAPQTRQNPPTSLPTVSPTASPVIALRTNSPTVPIQNDLTFAPILAPSTSPSVATGNVDGMGREPVSVQPTSVGPTFFPTGSPTKAPQTTPTKVPASATRAPTTQRPISSNPTREPTKQPTLTPQTNIPTRAPTVTTQAPTTRAPTSQAPISSNPTREPTKQPTISPSQSPSIARVTQRPTSNPTGSVETTSPTTPADGIRVQSARFEVNYDEFTATNSEFQLAEDVTLEYLQNFMESQFAFSLRTTLNGFAGSLISSDAPDSSATYDISLIFDTSSIATPTSAEVDLLVFAAFHPPFVSTLISMLNALPSGNSFSTTSAVTYTPANRRVLRIK